MQGKKDWEVKKKQHPPREECVWERSHSSFSLFLQQRPPAIVASSPTAVPPRESMPSCMGRRVPAAGKRHRWSPVAEIGKGKS